jgi:nucleoid-associated protein YgaU
MHVKKIKVKKGDTLWSLAQAHMPDEKGQGTRYKELFLINATTMVMDRENSPDKIGPNFIYEGDELFVLENVEFEPSGN